MNAYKKLFFFSCVFIERILHCPNKRLVIPWKIHAQTAKQLFKFVEKQGKFPLFVRVQKKKFFSWFTWNSCGKFEKDSFLYEPSLIYTNLRRLYCFWTKKEKIFPLPVFFCKPPQHTLHQPLYHKCKCIFFWLS